MKWILGSLFALYAVLNQTDESSSVFYKYDLFDSYWDKYRMGFSARRIKRKIKETDRPEVKRELARGLFYV